MKTRLYITPQSTINELWVNTPDIDATPNTTKCPIPQSMVHPLDTLKTNVPMKFYESIGIGIDIVTETVFNYPYPYLSEKIVWPILHNRPFLFVGAPFTLNFLHSKGFKTFSPLINESYDNEIDPNKRFIMLSNEISKLCDYTLQEIKELILSYQDICDHNFTIIKNLKKTEISQLKNRLNDYN